MATKKNYSLNKIQSISSGYFNNTLSAIESAAKKAAKNANSEHINRIKKEFIDKVNEIVKYNLNEYEKNAALINSRIEKLDENISEKVNNF